MTGGVVAAAAAAAGEEAVEVDADRRTMCWILVGGGNLARAER